MENTIDNEPQLEKPEDLTTETPLTQSQEAESKTGPSSTGTDPQKKLQDELAEAKDKYVRLYAEFENHRRRTAKEKLEMIQGANEQLLKALLPIVDDFERGEKSFKDKNDKESEGFFLIHNKFRKTLRAVRGQSNGGIKRLSILTRTSRKQLLPFQQKEN
ncbi:MAG: nucleotide exchange factor GrpE [Bacteroidota bacterium]